MAPRKRAAVDDSSSDEEVNVEKVVETKQMLDKIREDREKKRAQLRKDFDMKLADLRARIQETVEAHTKQLGAINKQQANRLEQAIEARENIDQLIREKLAELQKKGKTLAAVLEKGYEYRLEKARSLSTQASEQEQPKDQDQDQARRGKRVKVDLSST